MRVINVWLKWVIDVRRDALSGRSIRIRKDGDDSVSRPHGWKHAGAGSLLMSRWQCQSFHLLWPTHLDETIELWWIFMLKSLRSFSASYPTTSFFCLKYYWCHFSLVCSARFGVLSRLDMIIFRPFRRQRSQGRQDTLKYSRLLLDSRNRSYREQSRKWMASLTSFWGTALTNWCFWQQLVHYKGLFLH